MYKDKAEKACSQSEYEEAGRYYTLSAYEFLSKCDFPNPNHVTTGTDIGLAVYCFQNAAFIFRLEGNVARCRNRAEQAILVVEDFEEYVFRYEALQALAREIIADLYLICGNKEIATEQYDVAVEQYATVTETGWLAESIFEWTFEFCREIMHAAGNPISVEKQVSMLNSFEERVELKRERLYDSIQIILKNKNYVPGTY